MTNTWTVVLEKDPENPEELIMPLPPDLLVHMGWNNGDVLVWGKTDNEAFTLSKKDSDAPILSSQTTECGTKP